MIHFIYTVYLGVTGYNFQNILQSFSFNLLPNADPRHFDMVYAKSRVFSLLRVHL